LSIIRYAPEHKSPAPTMAEKIKINNLDVIKKSLCKYTQTLSYWQIKNVLFRQ